MKSLISEEEGVLFAGCKSMEPNTEFSDVLPSQIFRVYQGLLLRAYYLLTSSSKQLERLKKDLYVQVWPGLAEELGDL